MRSFTVVMGHPLRKKCEVISSMPTDEPTPGPRREQMSALVEVTAKEWLHPARHLATFSSKGLRRRGITQEAPPGALAHALLP
jgi:hypothetical protein